MPGFLIGNNKTDVELKNEYPNKCIYDELVVNDATIKRATLNKFLNDKAFCEFDDVVVVADGYLLNKNDLFEKYNVNNVAEMLKKMYLSCDECFFNEYRGSFSGAIFDKKCNKWIVFTNHIGDSSIYYTINDGTFFAGSQLNYVVDACKKNGVQLSVDENAAYQMLAFGFMEDDSTYANEIKRLRGGTYLISENGRVEVKTYHTFEKNKERFDGKSYGEIIDLLDDAFRRAVEIEYKKDEEYGYAHLADMSGGLDSRMNVYVAHAVKECDIQLITYSKSDYLDEKISKQIAADLKDALLVKPLDDALFLYDIEVNTRMLNGGSLFNGITGGKRLLEGLNMDKYGLEHTGMIGDVVIGTFCKNTEDLNAWRIDGKYSNKLSHKLNKDKSQKYRDTFCDHDVYLLYSRGFQGATNTYSLRRNFTEVASPFMDVDFMQFCLDMPIEYRLGHRIYKDWIIKKYPNAAKFKWEKTNSKVSASKLKIFINKVRNRGFSRIMSFFGLGFKVGHGMNPMGYWYANDKNLQEFYKEYERQAMPMISEIISKELKCDLENFLHTGNLNEKAMALTVLSSLKLYFTEG